MKVLLVDVDSKIPNLALMQLSAWHKSQGDSASFNEPNPDVVYASVIFSKNKHKVDGLKFYYPNSKIVIGGSGYDLSIKIPAEAQKIKPDYDLYPSEYSMGFTTRGCIRKCPFCVVRDKEGAYHKWQHPSDFHDPHFKTMMLLDNNWYANKEWFMETSQWIIDNDVHIIEHGMDIRILTADIARQLKKIKFDKPMKFAFDNMDNEDVVVNGIKILSDAGISPRSSVQIYVLVGFDTTEEQDKYRCRKLKELGTNAFVMPYKRTAWTKRIARWANRKWLYWSMDIDDYKEGV
jgi:hypothetical protein